ncbi:hypothetical protein SNE40_021010 [Patella caerulea]|uniref:Fibronectin type III-like domain-containing protein n=2 Tax=Patella caerulea TaxID=87958 RepID=A0AAN8GH73_PATCE
MFCRLILVVIVVAGISAEFPFRNISLSWDERVQDLVNRLTLQEMMEQMAHELPKVDQSVPSIPRLGIKNYTWITECLRGDVKAGNATSFPQALGLSATFDSDIIFRVARATGMEVRAKNNDFEKQGLYTMHKGLSCFSPVINIMRDARWGRNQETYGEDPYLTGMHAQQFVKGLQGDNPRFLLVNSGCKHFDAYAGPENIPVSRFSFDAQVSIRDWRTTFLPAFQKCVEAGTYNIMCSYNSINGVPSCANKELLTNILRDEWGFRGYVVSDAGAVEHIIHSHQYLNNSIDTVVACINAGVNLAVASFKYDYTPVYFSIVEAVNQGRLTIEKIREMMKPMWYTRMRLGEFDPPESNPYKALDLSVVESPEHQSLAVEAALKSFVLLKNKEFLPLRKLIQGKVSIIGPMADNKIQIFGDYGPNTDSKFIKTPLDTLKVLGTDFSYAAGCVDSTPCLKYDNQSIADAVKDSKMVIACLGLGPILEGELKDRATISLPDNQVQLVKDAIENSPPDTPLVLILFNAGPVDLRWAENYLRVVAIIEAFYPAQAAGEALYKMITLAEPMANPAGRLPFTWPTSESDMPAITNYTMIGRTYRYLTHQPLYPFGYGLSYSSFSYNNLKVYPLMTEIIGSVDVTNNGPFAGDEVVQTYISWPVYKEPTPRLQLVSFDRVSIDTGKTLTVNFSIVAVSLFVWSDDSGWNVPSGYYDIYVGGQQPNVTKSVGSNVLKSKFYFFPKS